MSFGVYVIILCALIAFGFFCTVMGLKSGLSSEVGVLLLIGIALGYIVLSAIVAQQG